MSNVPASLDGLGELLASGYSLSISGGHLIVNDIWYVNASGEQGKGRLAAPLTMIDQTRVGAPGNHQMYWSGTAACNPDRSPIPFAAQPISLTIDDTVYGFHLSNKPPEGFTNYVDLVVHYVTLISGPATQLFGVSPQTGAQYDVPEDKSPFKVTDTFSARAQIGDLNRLVSDDRIAIIGLGGTGAFVLDFIVKTPVYSIDAYDFDVFQVHNSFRSPGEVPFSFLGQLKTLFYQSKYDAFRHRLRFHNKRVAAGDEKLFSDITFAFVCIDDGEARREICEILLARKIPFIDVGMGVEKEAGRLDGLLRTTLFTDGTADRARAEVPFDKRHEAGAYRVFVQIAELNALNAAIAVVKYKQFRGFYVDDAEYFNSLLSIGSSSWLGVA
ncbi:ThiF family adenylyltransferase [Methylobacterium sp. J-072]|uniref:ThiF family adenylyltransferase n=1 Tax=Methylobacterium sp. J-072 TaxID=2836651 RepID=UPI001FBB025F|nr:ThiF family adenylyltransferase [Methylobacterium sp. J-072]MCJ2090967.1 ThiF family adenylyltransferase [Methylobacterium sp. J-072]